MSPYRAKQARSYQALGFHQFLVVGSLTPYRGKGVSAYQVPESNRAKYTVICRPATSGKWGKSVVIRALLNEEVK